MRRALHLFLAVTLGIDAIIVLCLAVRDFMLTRALVDTVGSTVLLAIGIVCTWAFVAVCRCYSTWLPTTLASQIGVALLAGYVWLTDQRSPACQLFGVTGVAAVIGAVAIFWVFCLARHAKAPFVKGIGAALAILPIFSLIQFWMQNDYLPRTSRPMVDIETELSPIGTSGRIIHVLAKVTMHNRGSVEADVVGALMRVTAYPKSSPQQPDRSHTVADAIDLTGWTSGDFRAVETSPASSQLLYADDVANVGTLLGPGETDSYKRLIDIDADTFGLTWLSFTAIFLTKRQLDDMRSCGGQRISLKQDPSEFWRQTNESMETPAGEHSRCLEVDIAPGGVGFRPSTTASSRLDRQSRRSR